MKKWYIPGLSEGGVTLFQIPDLLRVVLFSKNAARTETGPDHKEYQGENGHCILNLSGADQGAENKFSETDTSH